MRDIIIDQKDCRLSFDRQILILHHNSFRRPVMIPFGQIQSLTLVSRTELSSTLLTKLAEHKISVVILPHTPNSQPCFIQGRYSASVARRVAQYEITRDEQLAKHWASRLVKLKIHRQSQLLRHLNANQSIISKLNTIKQKLHHNLDMATIRGLEGSASALFFGEYRRFFDENLRFHNRNRRPPLDPVNVILSLSYTLLQSVYENAVHAVGFDAYLGVLHEISHGRMSLACDFTELQRCDIEHWVWQLFDHQILTPNDFSMTTNANKPCELLKVGRGRFYAEFMKIKPILQKTALRHVWLVQKRLSKNNDQQLNFMSEYEHE